jgi:hypothetical protein
MKISKLETIKKKRKYAKPKLEDGNPRGTYGRIVKSNGKRINLK